MVPENFEQYTAGRAAVGDNAIWLKDGSTCIVTLWNNEPLQVTPPSHIELKIVETDPGLRGDTATAARSRRSSRRVRWCGCRCSSTRAK